MPSSNNTRDGCKYQFSLLSRVQLFGLHWLQHTRLPCPLPTPRAYSSSCPLSQWCHPAISPSVIPFSSHLQSFPASWSFPMSQLCTSGGQSIGVSVSTSVLPMNIQDWFSLGWTGWISLQSKGLSRVFSNTTCQKNTAINDSKSGPSPESNHAGTLILDFSASRIIRNKYLLLKLPSLWYFVTAAQAD